MDFSRPKINSIRWLDLFTNRTFRKHRKLAIFHPHFVIRIFPSAFCHPHFIIRIFLSAFYHPHFSIRILSSAFFYPHFIIRHPPSAIRHPPPSGPHFTETPCTRISKNKNAVNRAIILFTQHPHYLCFFSLYLKAVY